MVDAFDVLTTERAYRPTGTIELAVAELEGERGKQFDPEVVDVFLEVFDEARAIYTRYPGPEEPAAPPPEDAQMTLQAAAATLSISPSRLRRWADLFLIHR